ncbi:hypothetical protein QTP88_018203 [Uroleucon formosanum]
MPDLTDARVTRYCAGKRYSYSGRAPGAADPDSATVRARQFRPLFIPHFFPVRRPPRPKPPATRRLESAEIGQKQAKHTPPPSQPPNPLHGSKRYRRHGAKTRCLV